jgi:RNA polymerase sigma-70 factor, ECF subfamily
VATVPETAPGAFRAAAGSKEDSPVAHDDDPLDHANLARSRHGARVDELLRRRSRLTPEESALFTEVFPSIVDEHYDGVMLHLRRYLDPADAYDVAQEAFVTFYEKVLDAGFPDHLRGFLVALADGKGRNLLRVRAREPFSAGLPSSGSEPPRTPPDLAGALDDMEATRQFLPQLIVEHQQVVTLVMLQGLELEEAALVLGIPAGTVKSRLRAAKRCLRELAGPMFPDRGGQDQ